MYKTISDRLEILPQSLIQLFIMGFEELAPFYPTTNKTEDLLPK